MFSQVGSGQLATSMTENLGLLEWETVSWDLNIFSLGFQAVFFLLTVVILMNLLIAMMNHTFAAVNAQAVEEWRLKFATLVKEYFEITVLPVPINLLEHGINMCMRRWMDKHKPSTTGICAWGRHYVWPVSTLRYEIQMAKQAYALLAKRKKAAKKHLQIVGKT